VLEQPEKGLALLAKAIALDPNLTAARNWSGWTNIYLGNSDAALEQFSVSLRLNPLDPRLFLPQTGMAYAHFLAGRYEEGLSWANRAVQTQPNFPGGPRMLMANLAMVGRIDEARRARDICLKFEPTLCVAAIGRRTPFRRHQDIEKLAEAYRTAGVPE
jgi:adenylate cyclase